MKITHTDECPCDDVLTFDDLEEGDVYEKYDVETPKTVYLVISSVHGPSRSRIRGFAADLKFPRTVWVELDMRVRKLCAELTYSEEKS